MASSAAERLLATALAFPTLARRPRAVESDELPAAKRQAFEQRAQELAKENQRVIYQPVEDPEGLTAQLQDSIKELQSKLFQATCAAQSAHLLHERTQQMSRPIDEAATLDTLSIQVLAAHQRVASSLAEEAALADEVARVTEMSRASMQALSHRDDARILDSEELRLIKERSALLNVFRTLILESRVDWARDDVLKRAMIREEEEED